jgi:hypothetical protein
VDIPTCGLPHHEQNQQFTAAAADALICGDFVACDDTTDATQWWYRTSSVATGQSGTAGIALYTADGSTQLAEGTAAYSDFNTIVHMTGLGPFSTSTGTLYRLCICSSTGTGGYKAPHPVLAADITRVTAFHNAVTVHQGIAANSCVSGDPPATTGALTGGEMSAPWLRIRP